MPVTAATAATLATVSSVATATAAVAGVGLGVHGALESRRAAKRGRKEQALAEQKNLAATAAQKKANDAATKKARDRNTPDILSILGGAAGPTSPITLLTGGANALGA